VISTCGGSAEAKRAVAAVSLLHAITSLAFSQRTWPRSLVFPSLRGVTKMRLAFSCPVPHGHLALGLLPCCRGTVGGAWVTPCGASTQRERMRLRRLSPRLLLSESPPSAQHCCLRQRCSAPPEVAFASDA